MMCGRTLQHPREEAKGLSRRMYGVSYCLETDHCSMLHRDADAARKIGYRFLCQWTGMSLGTWKPGAQNETDFSLRAFHDLYFPDTSLQRMGSSGISF